jgi:hypothetical protein
LEAHLSSRGAYDDIADEINLFRRDTPSAELLHGADDQFHWLLRILGPELRGIAEARFNGNSIEEIARARGVSTKTIERRLESIRQIWREVRSADSGDGNATGPA